MHHKHDTQPALVELLRVPLQDMLEAGSGPLGLPIRQQQFAGRPDTDAAAAPSSNAGSVRLAKSGTASGELRTTFCMLKHVVWEACCSCCKARKTIINVVV